MLSANTDQTVEAFKQAVTDLRDLIYWLKSRNEKVLLLAISTGGLVANLTSVVEDKIDCLISVFFASNFADILWNSVLGKFVKADIESHGFTLQQLETYWAIFNPINFQPSRTVR